jgi:hypothetical protein
MSEHVESKNRDVDQYAVCCQFPGIDRCITEAVCGARRDKEKQQLALISKKPIGGQPVLLKGYITRKLGKSITNSGMTAA